MKISLLKLSEKIMLVIAGGDGLIGGSIVKNLLILDNGVISSSCLSDRNCSKEELIDTLRDIFNSFIVKRYDELIFIFACGKGGFSLEEEIAIEQQKRLIKILDMFNSIPIFRKRFILISSLGAHLSPVESVYKSYVFSIEKEVSKLDSFNIIRLPGVWGFKENTRKPIGLVANLLYSVHRRDACNIYGNLNTLRSYLAADNVGKTIADLMKENFTIKIDSIINLSSNFSYTIQEIINLVKRTTGRRVFFMLNYENIVDEKSHVGKLFDGNNIPVLECLHTEIKKTWRNL